MAHLIARATDRWRHKPHSQWQIDREALRALGLVAYWGALENTPGILRDLIGLKHMTTVAGDITYARDTDRGLYVPLGSNKQVYLTGDQDFQISTFTASILFKFTGTHFGNAGVMSTGDFGSAGVWAIGVNTLEQAFGHFRDGTAGTDADYQTSAGANTQLNVGEIYHIHWVCDGVNGNLYIDGQNQGSTSLGDGIANTSGSYNTSIGSVDALTSRDASIDLYHAAFSNKAWTAEMVLADYLDPYSVFEPRTKRVWIEGSTVQTINPSGLATAEAAGSQSVQPGAVNLSPGAMASAEAHGTPTVANLNAPIFESFTEKIESVNATSTTIDKPSGTVDDDLLVLLHVVDGSNTPNVPGGFTSILTSQMSTAAMRVSWRKADNEPANYSISSTDSQRHYALLFRISGASGAPVDLSASSTGLSTTPTCPTLTPTVESTLVLRLFGTDDGGVDTPDSGYPSGHNGVAANQTGSSTGHVGGGAAWLQQAIIAPLGEASFTIDSLEAWMAATVVIAPKPADQNLTITGKASDEIIGSQTLLPITTLTPSGMATAEQTNNPSVTVGAVTLTPTSAQAGEQFGAMQLNPIYSFGVVSIGSGEAHGAQTVDTITTLSPTGKPTDEAHGSATLQPGAVTIDIAGLATQQAFGDADLQPGAVNIDITGMLTAEQFGPILVFEAQTVVAPSANTGESFGTLTLLPGAVSVTVTGKSTDEAFGSQTVAPGAVNLEPGAISGAEAMGSTTVIRFGMIYPNAMSDGAFGTASMQPGAVSIQATGKSTDEAFGSQAVAPGSVSLSPGAMASDESVSAPTVDSVVYLQADPVLASEAFGVPTVVPGTVVLIPVAALTAEQFGTLQALPGAVTLLAQGIPTAELFDLHLVAAILRSMLLTSGIQILPELDAIIEVD